MVYELESWAPNLRAMLSLVICLPEIKPQAATLPQPVPFWLLLWLVKLCTSWHRYPLYCKIRTTYTVFSASWLSSTACRHAKNVLLFSYGDCYFQSDILNIHLMSYLFLFVDILRQICTHEFLFGSWLWLLPLLWRKPGNYSRVPGDAHVVSLKHISAISWVSL